MSSQEAFNDFRDGSTPAGSKSGVEQMRFTRERCSMVGCKVRNDETAVEGACTLKRQRRRRDFQYELEKMGVASAVLLTGF